ncbi:hypothetical protein Tco_1582080, partial [Tanacetum coccineum]
MAVAKTRGGHHCEGYRPIHSTCGALLNLTTFPSKPLPITLASTSSLMGKIAVKKASPRIQSTRSFTLHTSSSLSYGTSSCARNPWNQHKYLDHPKANLTYLWDNR